MRITGMPKQGEHSITLDAGEFHALKHLLKTEQDSEQLEFEKVEQGGRDLPKIDQQSLFNRRTKERRSPVVSRRAGERCTPCGRRTLVSRRKS